MNWKRTYRQFWHRHPWVTCSFYLFIFIAFFLSFIIGPHPFYCKFKGDSYFLIWSKEAPNGSNLQQALLEHQFKWEEIDFDLACWPIFHIDPYKTHQELSWLPPGTFTTEAKFILGSYELGRDVLTSCLVGLQQALFLSFLSMCIALILGLPLGLVGAYYQKTGIRLSIWSVVGFLLILGISWYLILLLISFKILNGFIAILYILLLMALIGFSFNLWNRKPGLIIYPDFYVVKSIEFIKSLPLLMIMLILLQWIDKPNLLFLSLFIGLFYAFSIAKYTRYIVRSEKEMTYISVFKSLGYSDLRIMLKHLLPAAFKTLLPYIALGMGSVVLLEASISFLGLGLPVESISLGQMMHSARSYPSAWWVVVFPGACVFWIVYCFQTLGTGYTSKFNE